MYAPNFPVLTTGTLSLTFSTMYSYRASASWGFPASKKLGRLPFLYFQSVMRAVGDAIGLRMEVASDRSAVIVVLAGLLDLLLERLLVFLRGGKTFGCGVGLVLSGGGILVGLRD